MSSNATASSKDLASLSGMLSITLANGVPVLEAMAIASKRLANAHLAKAVEEGRKSIEDGKGLAVILEEYPNLFPTEFLALVRLGETSGTIDKVFAALATFYESDPALR